MHVIVPEFLFTLPGFWGRSTPVRRRRPGICHVGGVGGVMIGSGPHQFRLFLPRPGISKKGAEKSPCASVGFQVHQALTVTTVPGNCRKRPGRVEPWWSSGGTWVEPGRIQAESRRYSVAFGFVVTCKSRRFHPCPCRSPPCCSREGEGR